MFSAGAPAKKEIAHDLLLSKTKDSISHRVRRDHGAKTLKLFRDNFAQKGTA